MIADVHQQRNKAPIPPTNILMKTNINTDQNKILIRNKSSPEIIHKMHKNEYE